MDRTAAEQNLSLRDPPQAENPAEQDSIFNGLEIQLYNIAEHENKVAGAAKQHKYMKDFMGTEVAVSGVKLRKLQCVDDASDGVENTADQKPQECSETQTAPQLRESKDTCPSHANVQNRREELRAIDPKQLDENADDGDAPDRDEQRDTDRTLQYKQADRCIRTGDQNGDHGMIQLFQDAIDFYGNVKCVIDRAGGVEQDHACHKNCAGSAA